MSNYTPHTAMDLRAIKADPKSQIEPVVDNQRKPITLGTVVVLRYTTHSTVSPPRHVEMFGVVTKISDFDIEDGDYGQPVGINPDITVLFTDGTSEEFGTFAPYGEYYTAEDLEVAVHGPKEAN